MQIWKKALALTALVSLSLLWIPQSYAQTQNSPTKKSTQTKKKKVHSKKPAYQNALPKETTPFANAFSLEQIVADMNQKASTGVIVRALPSGKVIYQKDANTLYTPASNMKVITAFAALKFLGPNFSYHTDVLTDATNINPADGVLQGNLYLKYEGDPSLMLEDVNRLFRSLSQQGIHQVTGSFYVDTTRYDNDGVSPGTVDSDRAYCYGAPVNAAIINRNCLSFRVLPGQPGGLARLSFPMGVALPIQNAVVTRTNANCGLSLQHASDNQYVLNGCISPKRTTAFTIPLPADNSYGRLAAAHLISANGITVEGNDLPRSNNLKVLVSHESEPLSTLVVQMMKKSDNLIANTLFKTIGSHYSQQSASWENSSNAVKAILQKNGVDTTGMVIIDGSGLSRDDRISPDQFTQVLMAAYKDPTISDDYIRALPVGGLNGTLKNRLGSKDIIGKVKAKTGSMHGVSSLSGFVETRANGMLVFSIVVNDFAGGLYPYRMMEDKLCRILRASY